MLIFDMQTVGNKLLGLRKRQGLTQALVAERADISERSYADIERGTVNMRVETLLRICEALHITPNEILTQDSPTLTPQQEEVLARLDASAPKTKQAALHILDTFLQSIDKQ